MANHRETINRKWTNAAIDFDLAAYLRDLDECLSQVLKARRGKVGKDFMEILNHLKARYAREFTEMDARLTR